MCCGSLFAVTCPVSAILFITVTILAYQEKFVEAMSVAIVGAVVNDVSLYFFANFLPAFYAIVYKQSLYQRVG
jgi:hypothetical protein